MTNNDTIIQSLSAIISRITGVQLGEKQKHMVESRLTKRMLDLNLSTFDEYFRYFKANEHVETQGLISLLTTHHTYFFREFSQIQYVCETMLPELIPIIRARPDRTLRVWSAASSYGQEVYSLAMALHFHLKQLAPDLKFHVHGTDVDAKSVQVGINGVYARKELNAAPAQYCADFWMRGTGAISNYVKAKNSIKSFVSFDTVNLQDQTQLAKQGMFDIIFCRNVFIYFTPEQIRTITHQLLKHVHPHGGLFIGISESLHGLNVDAHSIGPSIYRAGTRPSTRTQGVSASTKPEKEAKSPFPSPTLASEKPLRVLCVDDSPTVIAILKKVFSAGSGFELVGTAVHGKDAIDKVKVLKPDVMTLDIHMPEMDGVSYLKSQFNKEHCPVVMISSVSRENQDLAIEALNAGASDYIEKPSLNQLSERIEEIRTKVRCAYQTKASPPVITSADHDFKRKMVINEPNKKTRVCLFQLSDRKKVLASIKETSKLDPPTLLIIGSDSNLDATHKLFQAELGHQLKTLSQGNETLEAGVVYLASIKTASLIISQRTTVPHSISFLVYSALTEPEQKLIKDSRKGQQLLVTESDAESSLAKIADDVFPTTSFIALSQEFFANDPSAGITAKTPKAA